MTSLDLLSSRTDDEIMEGDGAYFADLLRDRAWRYAIGLYDPDAWTLDPLDEATYTERLTFYLRRRSWAEWYFGTVTVSRQISLLGGTQPEIELKLARQIQDEVRHHDVFAANSRRHGGEWRIERFPPPPHLADMRRSQEAASSAGQLAAANQLAGEVVLLIHGQDSGNVLRSLVPDSISEALDDIESDEPAHVELGHRLVAAHATSPASRQAMAATQEAFLGALGRQHTHEVTQLGADRHAPLPEFVPDQRTPVGSGLALTYPA